MSALNPALVEAVKADPADDLAWLALADALEEEGHPGPAELHRLSVLLRRPDDAQRRRHEEQLQQLLASGVRAIMPTETVILAPGVGLTLALIAPGTFLMGSPADEPGRIDGEGPLHRVTITRGFYLSVHPVTQAQWQAVLGGNPSYFKGDDRPVEKVSWHDCQEFCERLSARKRRRYRLPTEAEWEYSCRAGTTTPFWFGPTISARLANFDAAQSYAGSKRGTNRRKTTAVGHFSPNPWGLFDTHGNVLEWVQDWYSRDYYQASPESDPCGPRAGSVRVLRGGSWRTAPQRCRSADRSFSSAGHGSSGFGCRVVLCLD